MSKPREETPFHQEHTAETENLDQQYHQIGIPAVLAAVRYQHEQSDEEKTDHPVGSEDKPA
jgi:hypothetical protein